MTSTTPHRLPLAGLRVLDLSQGPAVGIATMVLADFGADVLVIEGPEPAPLDALPARPMWRRGKRTLALDLRSTEDAARFERLCAGADVLVTGLRPRALKRHGLDFDALHARHAHLIVGQLTGFGSSGPLADYPGYEHVVAAVTGRMRLFAGTVEREGPVYSALQVAVHASAQALASGLLAALIARGDGPGRLVETSLLQGIQAYEQGAMLATQFRDQLGELYERLVPAPDVVPTPSLYYHPAQAADGRWLQFGNLLPHLFDNFLLVTELIDIVADPEWQPAQLALPPAKQEAFRERMLARVQERTAADWQAAMIANGGVVGGPYQTTQEALRDPDIVANGHVVERAEGGVQIGPLARLTRTPGRPGAAEQVDPTGAGWASEWAASPRPLPQAQEKTQGTPAATTARQAPLTGIRVLEIATIIAAPMGAANLADMGASVTKVEQLSGDPYRGLGLGVGSTRVNAGKRSISLDLKSAAGLEIVCRLAAESDVLIHNFRPGVPERLGIDFDSLAAINPDLVYLQVNGYGPDGPGAQRPSTHPIPGAALGGVLLQLGDCVPHERLDIDALRSWCPRIMRANEVNPDPNTAAVVATSALLGLAARDALRRDPEATGAGQRILIDMYGANAYANSDDFLDYPSKPPRALPDALGLGLSPTYRLYPCAAGQWCFLALVSDTERARFRDVLARAGLVAPDLALQSGDDAATADALAALFATRSADDWEALLAADAGLGCVRADGPPPNEFWLRDAHARRYSAPVSHSRWGDYQRPGSVLHFDGRQLPLAGAPLAGADAKPILTELGYDSESIADLFERGVLWQEEAESN
ncbi:MAG: CoA transferase [Pseudomonadota bacterium]